MALVHDLAECIIGDITPVDTRITPEEKIIKETEAMSNLTSLITQNDGDNMRQLFHEFESQETEASHIVKDLDRFDMILQAFEYEQREKRPGFLQEFFDSTNGKFKTDYVKPLVQELYAKRNAWRISLSS